MATVHEIADFVSKLPEDARVVLVCQRGKTPFMLATDELGDCMEGAVALSTDRVGLDLPWPNWPRAVFHGVLMSIGQLSPDFEPESGAPPQDESANP